MNEPQTNTQQNEVILRFLAEPDDINFGGKVHGGAVMKWIDQAGYACAVGWSRLYCVTLYVGGIRFYKPIQIGQMVELRAKVAYTGRTSMHITVDVHAGDLREQTMAQTTHCIIVFVAVDDAYKPTPVPEWTPVSPEEIARRDYVVRLKDLRQVIEQEMKGFQG